MTPGAHGVTRLPFERALPVQFGRAPAFHRAGWSVKGPDELSALARRLGDADIGSPYLAGSAFYNNGLWTVNGGGADIWNAADQFNFASTSDGSDGSITAQVTSLQNSDPGSGWSKAGLMFRNDSTTGSVNVSIVATAVNGVNFQCEARPAANVPPPMPAESPVRSG